MHSRGWVRKICWIAGALVLGLLLALHARSRWKAALADGVAKEYGQTLEGAGSANFSWLRIPGTQFGIAFHSPKTGTLKEITLQWKSKGGYGGGTFGVYHFTLHPNGPANFPDRMVIGNADGITPMEATDGCGDGALHFPITASLQAGEIYHLVVINTDPDPKSNWSSPNSMMSRAKPWEGGGNRAECNTDGKWHPWASLHDPFVTEKSNELNGAYCPLMLSWDDGTTTGDPYYSSAIKTGAYFYGQNCAGELIVWKQPEVTIRQVGISVWKQGAPGKLLYHLEEDGRNLASGTIATAGKVGDIATWVYAKLPQPVELQKGHTYRLWFASPDSPDEDNCYCQYVPYGDNRPAAWLEGGWGGTASHYISGDGATWTDRKNADLTFSLQ